MVEVYHPVLSLAISDEKTGCPAQSSRNQTKLSPIRSYTVCLLESVTARTKRDHWVLGLPKYRWYTVLGCEG